MMKSGIYKIQSKQKPDRIYIGSAKDLMSRKRHHFYRLKDGDHRNVKLQRHYDKYGESDLFFEVIEYCESSQLLNIEQKYMDKYNPYFNIFKIAGSALGYKPSRESIEKWRQKLIGRKFTQEHCNRISESKKGMKLSDENKLKIGLAHLGKSKPKHTEEHNNKISKSLKGRIPWNKGLNNNYRGKNGNCTNHFTCEEAGAGIVHSNRSQAGN